MIVKKQGKEICKVLSWQNAPLESGLIQMFLETKYEQLAIYCMQKGNPHFGTEDFYHAIRSGQFILANCIVTKRRYQPIVNNPAVQRDIVNAMVSGSNCL